jgi:thiol:disulfide interchange protein DsbA
VLAAAFAVPAARAEPAAPWIEGVNYFLMRSPQTIDLPRGKVAVTEVFSYACPACNVFQPTMRKLVKSLPANAVVNYVPASFNAAEDWPMFQRAFYTAQVLGVAAKTHDQMFDAVWRTGELAVVDPQTGRLKSTVPTIEDAARFYAKAANVPVKTFLETAQGFSVDTDIGRAEQFVFAGPIDRTPTLVVAGKYRLHSESAGDKGDGQRIIALVNWLVAKESAAAGPK